MCAAQRPDYVNDSTWKNSFKFHKKKKKILSDLLRIKGVKVARFFPLLRGGLNLGVKT